VWRKPKPGGTDGVDDLDVWSKPMNSSTILSATNASTEDVASSRDGRPWSSKRFHVSMSSFLHSAGENEKEKSQGESAIEAGTGSAAILSFHGSIIVFGLKEGY
jgi:hypothetical protein